MAEELVTSGDNPEVFHVVIRLPNAYMKEAFEQWRDSGDFREKFWQWMGTGPVPCHYCNVFVAEDADGWISSTHTSDPNPRYCFGAARTNGKHLIHADTLKRIKEREGG